MHAAIEAATKNAEVWEPREWLTHCRTARQSPFPYTAEWLDHKQFMDWKEMQRQLNLGEELDDSDERVKWAALRQVKVIRRVSKINSTLHVQF